ncbi:MAG TPA: hypothetical protein VND80_11665 [Steroidobacteraceae bacterium]|nr:hypothetical protein [Steroidobacteraceae bacterium]
MDEPGQSVAALAAAGISVAIDRSVRVAALRYFDVEEFSLLLHRVLGEGLPLVRRFARGRCIAAEEPFILLWRAPTESWLLCAAAAPIDAVRRDTAASHNACVVDQTGGILALHMSGARTLDLLARLGSPASIPRVGEASSGRFADIPATAVGLDAGEFLLLVERVHVDHLLEWIGETLTDF